MKEPRAATGRLARFNDKLAEWLIRIAGLGVILAMLAMLALIVGEALPLFLPAGAKAGGSVRLPEGVVPTDVAALGAASDLRRQAKVAAFLTRDGRQGVAGPPGGTGAHFALSRLPGAPDGAVVRSVEAQGDRYSVLWSDGTLSLYALRADFSEDSGGTAGAPPAFVHLFDAKLDPASGTPRFAMLRGDETEHTAVAVYPDGAVLEKSLRKAKGLLARGKGTESERRVRPGGAGAIVAAALNGSGGQLYLGTDGGNLISVNFPSDAGADPAVETVPVFRDRRPITALSFLHGGYALAVGDDRGGLSVWFPRREEGIFRLRQATAWQAGGSGIAEIAASGRDRGFMALGENGGLRWLYSTNGRELLDRKPEAGHTVRLALNSRGDTMLLLNADATLDFVLLDAPYPEAGWRGFFSRILYEGYEKPAFVWQSTGSDDAEPKFSLVPLLFGSVKGAGYALLFATPLALAAAMYLSQFARREWRARLKPAVEMLAAVPSVVIGFLAALWLAPWLEGHLQFIARNHPYDQRNCLVIAVAMGFAVIPTVFSLAEDAISAVPPSLSAASLALGASKWQTVWRVVLPSASPGIFTAVMLGLGRAVGETMIVLMATGNTPIISLSPFNGMRTLAANIAVEMPEAPVGGTLYRTLFLCALLLFLMTLVINSAAEYMRQRLRSRYGRL